MNKKLVSNICQDGDLDIAPYNFHSIVKNSKTTQLIQQPWAMNNEADFHDFMVHWLIWLLLYGAKICEHCLKLLKSDSKTRAKHNM